MLGRKPQQNQSRHEQGLLNYGGPKLWKRSESGDPDLQGAWSAWQETGTEPEQTRDQAIANYRGRAGNRNRTRADA